MTRIILALIFAILFIVASFSKPLIPWVTDDLSLCTLDGQKNYFGTSKLSNSNTAGLVSFVVIFLISLFLMNLIFPKRRLIMWKWKESMSY